MRIQWITGCILRRSIRGSGSGSGIDDFRLPRRVTLSTSYICDRFYQFGGVPGGYDELSIDQLPGKLMITKTAEKNDRGKREGSCFSSYHSAKVQRDEEDGSRLCRLACSTVVTSLSPAEMDIPILMAGGRNWHSLMYPRGTYCRGDEMATSISLTPIHGRKSSSVWFSLSSFCFQLYIYLHYSDF